MSKSTVKKFLQSMPKESIIGMVMEMYSARKEAQEYLEFYTHPNERVSSRNTRISSVRSSIPQGGVSRRRALPFAEKPWPTSRS